MKLHVFLVAISFLGISMSSRAQIPNAVPCVGTAVNGARVPVRQVQGQSGAWAMTSWPPPFGYPVTVYSPVYFRLSPLLQNFTSWHECGHAVTRDPNEFAANCFALEHGHYSTEQIAGIGQFFHNLPFTVGPQYGGSGAAFWDGTMARCPQFFPKHPLPTPPVAEGDLCDQLNQAIADLPHHLNDLRADHNSGSDASPSTLQLEGSTRCTIDVIGTLGCRMNDDFDSVANDVDACLTVLKWNKRDTGHGWIYSPPAAQYQLGGSHINVMKSAAQRVYVYISSE